MSVFGRFFDGCLRLVGLNSGATDDASLESERDREFAAVILTIANCRKADRRTAIDGTHLFQPMLTHLSLIELRDYILSRYPTKGSEHLGTKHHLVDLQERELKSFNRAFVYKDFLRIVFTYSDAWETVDVFRANLLNDRL